MTVGHGKLLYDKLKKNWNMEMMVLDAGYKTPAIARELLKEGIQPSVSV